MHTNEFSISKYLRLLQALVPPAAADLATPCHMGRRMRLAREGAPVRPTLRRGSRGRPVAAAVVEVGCLPTATHTLRINDSMV